MVNMFSFAFMDEMCFCRQYDIMYELLFFLTQIPSYTWFCGFH